MPVNTDHCREPLAGTLRELCRRIEAGVARADEPGGKLDLRALADAAGVSPWHLQRRFKAFVGVSPRAYAEACRLRLLRDGLRRQPSVTAAIHAAGYGSGSRVYERTAERLGMTPGQYRKGGAGLAISWATARTPVGLLLMAATDRGLCSVQLGDSRAALLQALQAEFPAARIASRPCPQGEALVQWTDALRLHLAGQAAMPHLPLDIRGTALQDPGVELPCRHRARHRAHLCAGGPGRGPSPGRTRRGQRLCAQPHRPPHSLPPGHPGRRRPGRLPLGTGAQEGAAARRSCSLRNGSRGFRSGCEHGAPAQPPMSALSHLLRELPVRRPFPWARLLAYLGPRLNPASERIDAETFCRREGRALITVRWDARRARLNIGIDRPPGTRTAARALARSAALFDIGFDALPMQAVLERCPLLAPRIALVPGMRPLGAWSPFELCLRTVIGQQVSVAAAATLMQRLGTRCGGVLSPASLLASDLSAIGMPARRVATLLHLARAIDSGGIDLQRHAWPDVDAALGELPGFGPWTRAYLAIRLGRDPDAFPEGDLGLQRAAGAGSARELLHLAERWRPWRAHAATYLWAVPAAPAR